MKSFLSKICPTLLTILIIVSLLSGYVDIGIPSFDGLGVALIYINIVLLILGIAFLLITLVTGGKSILNQKKMLGEKASYAWRNTRVAIIFVMAALSGHVLTAVLYVTTLVIYRVFEYTARLEYKKLSDAVDNVTK